MKTKRLLSTGLVFALTILISSQASAMMWGGGHGPMMSGPGMMYSNAQTLTDTQQDTVREIEKKYQLRLAEAEKVLRNKAAQLQTAQAKETTTIGELDKLRNELYSLEQNYWSLRDKLNREISSTIGTGYYGNMGWRPGYCDWHDDHPGMYGNATPRMYGRRGPMMAHSGWCRW